MLCGLHHQVPTSHGVGNRNRHFEYVDPFESRLLCYGRFGATLETRGTG